MSVWRFDLDAANRAGTKGHHPVDVDGNHYHGFNDNGSLEGDPCNGVRCGICYVGSNPILLTQESMKEMIESGVYRKL